MKWETKSKGFLISFIYFLISMAFNFIFIICFIIMIELDGFWGEILVFLFISSTQFNQVFLFYMYFIGLDWTNKNWWSILEISSNLQVIPIWRILVIIIVLSIVILIIILIYRKAKYDKWDENFKSKGEKLISFIAILILFIYPSIFCLLTPKIDPFTSLKILFYIPFPIITVVYIFIIFQIFKKQET